MKENKNLITAVRSKSIAEEMEIEAGDILLSINGKPVSDIIDYKYLISDEYIELEIKKRDGQVWDLDIEKEYDEDLGISFQDPTIDGARCCANRCMFCFIDQLPPGMRSTLYFKDDDSRLSFLQGNFVTLTNMTDRDIDRIIKYRISPLNISVHTTNPELRVRMLGNRNAGNIMDRIARLSEGGISMNCQIVLCRGVNDGDELEGTLRRLFSFHSSIRNVAVVPVGLTRYREGLQKLVPFDAASSEQTIRLIERLQKEFKSGGGELFVRASDEFYIMAGHPLPDADSYGEYEQLEDGVGMISLFIGSVDRELAEAPANAAFGEISVATGMSARGYVSQAFSRIGEKFKDLKINVYAIRNNFFGESITVSGLITGKDLIEQLSGKPLGEALFIPSNMLRSGEDVLLDDVTLDELKEVLGVKIVVCSFEGGDLMDKICKAED